LDLADAPWYVSNLTPHNDLKKWNEILRLAERYKAQTANHDNKLIEVLYTNGPVTRRLNRTWPQDFINQWNRLQDGESSLDVPPYKLTTYNTFI
jgi:hypothetical protein